MQGYRTEAHIVLQRTFTHWFGCKFKRWSGKEIATSVKPIIGGSETERTDATSIRYLTARSPLPPCVRRGAQNRSVEQNSAEVS
uniref:Uncharacterized protein n=1 Tax=Setaria digitata TaxID=48799 RepID=A0A915PCP5_9BILA